MKPLNRMSEMNDISWWNKCEKIANVAIDSYNLWQRKKEIPENVLVEFEFAYKTLHDKPVDYSEMFDVIKTELENAGFDVSFYHGF